jgi:ABC-type antimicrobial peptide transport system ATPase subunit
VSRPVRFTPEQGQAGNVVASVARVADDLRERLRHVRWIGGGSGGAKSTVARALASVLRWTWCRSAHAVVASALRGR